MRDVETIYARERKEDAVSRTSPPASTSASDLVELLQGWPVTLNDAQRRRLHWLTELNGQPEVWSGDQDLSPDCRLAMVVKPPTGLQTEQVRNALADDGVVVIPCGEDPAYDRLKSELFGFGTVGVDGTRGPHQMWWGGRGRPAFTLPAPNDEGSVSCVNTKTFLQRVSPCEAPPLVPDAQSEDLTKAERILTVWQNSEQPTLWIDPDRAIACDAAMLPTNDCDFAVVRRDRSRITTHGLYFGRRHAAEALLRTWTGLCRRYPALDEDFLLDQAWGLVTSQIALDTLWLPPDFRLVDCGHRESASPVVTHAFDDGPTNAAAIELLADLSFVTRMTIARRAERTGFPELLLPAPAGSLSDRSAVVVVRDIHCRGSRALAATIETLADAFTVDPAEFHMLEVVLCERHDDLRAALKACRRRSVLVMTPAFTVTPDLFRRMAAAGDTVVFTEGPLRVANIADYRTRRSAIVAT